MRLYKCDNLAQYIAQLEIDLGILKAMDYASKSGEYPHGIHLADGNRDTTENHSEILGKHMDNLRHDRIERNRNKT